MAFVHSAVIARGPVTGSDGQLHPVDGLTGPFSNPDGSLNHELVHDAARAGELLAIGARESLDRAGRTRPNSGSGWTLHESKIRTTLTEMSEVIERLAAMADQAHPDAHSALPAGPVREQAVLAWATHAVAYAQAVRTTALAPHPDQVMLDSYVNPIGAALRLIANR